MADLWLICVLPGLIPKPRMRCCTLFLGRTWRQGTELNTRLEEPTGGRADTRAHRRLAGSFRSCQRASASADGRAYLASEATEV